MIYKIILADDHPFLLSGLVEALKAYPHLQVVATAADGHSLITETIAHKPHLIVTDLNMPGMDGLQTIKQLRNRFADLKILVLTNYNQPELMQEVQALGANGFLVKNMGVHDLVEALETVLANKPYFKPLEKNTAIPEGFFMDEFLKKFQLTKREVTIITLICEEKTSKQIAAELYLSELTISTHRRNIFRKLEINNIAGLLNFARQHQLIQ